MHMAIKSASTWIQRCPLLVPFRVAYGATIEAEPCLVVISDERGNTGLGEGVPSSNTPADQRQRAAALVKDMLVECIGIEVPAALEQIYAKRIDVLENFPYAFAAVELALLDLHAQQLEKPLHQLFGKAGLEGCFTDITLPLMESDEISSFWENFRHHGFPIVKIKVSGELTKDIKHVTTMLNLLAQGTKITLDGNQGFTVKSALSLVEELTKLSMTPPIFFEQPLPKNDWVGLAELSKKSPVAICLDESVTTALDAQRVVDHGVAPMINLKTMKSGFRETLKIIDIATKNSIKLMIGGMVESEIGMAGSLHLLCGTGKIQYADLDTPFFYRERLTEASPWHQATAWLKCETKPGAFGLGLRLLEGLRNR